MSQPGQVSLKENVQVTVKQDGTVQVVTVGIQGPPGPGIGDATAVAKGKVLLGAPGGAATYESDAAKATTAYVDSLSASISNYAAQQLAAHASRTDNPHAVTKAQLGLANVDNTSDANKPISTAQATALALKADKTYTDTQDAAVASAANSALTAHASRTDNPHATTKLQVGLGNVDNTSDANKPVSTAQAIAIDVAGRGRGASVTVTTTATGFSADYVAPGNTNSQASTDGDVLNAAFAMLATLGGGTLYSRGTFFIKTPGVKVFDNCTWNGLDATYLVYASGSAYTGIIHNSEAILTGQINTNQNIRIMNLTINGNSANAAGNPPRDMIWLKMAKYAVVENCRIYDCSDSAIVLDVDTQQCTIRGNRIDGALDIGIYLSTSYDNEIYDNRVSNTASYGIRARTGSHRNLITRNRLIHCGYTNVVPAIVIDTSQVCKVDNNYVYDSGESGIWITTGTYTSVTNNTVYLAQGHGVKVEGVHRGLVGSNTIVQPGQRNTNVYSGVYLKNASESTVVGNYAGDSGTGARMKYAVEEFGTSDSNTVRLNTVGRSATGDIFLLGASSTRFNNPGSNDNSTTFLPEGTQLYYTDARADARITRLLGQANGLAGLDSGGKVPASQLPSYVDDVLEYATVSAFPAFGETGKLYIAINDGTSANPARAYRWSGTAYFEIEPSPGSTDAVPEGTSNKYFTSARAAAAAPVQMVNGQSGAVVLAAADVAALAVAGGTVSGILIVQVTSAVTPSGSGTYAFQVKQGSNGFMALRS